MFSNKTHSAVSQAASVQFDPKRYTGVFNPRKCTDVFFNSKKCTGVLVFLIVR